MVRIGRARKSSMPPDVLYHQYGQALLDSVRDGSYPESEEVISAELPPAAIPDILNNLEQTRNDVKVCTGSRIYATGLPLRVMTIGKYSNHQ